MEKNTTEIEQTAIQRMIELVNDIAKSLNEDNEMPNDPIGAMVILTFKSGQIAVTNYGCVKPSDLLSVLEHLAVKNTPRKPQADEGIAE